MSTLEEATTITGGCSASLTPCELLQRTYHSRLHPEVTVLSCKTPYSNSLMPSSYILNRFDITASMKFITLQKFLGYFNHIFRLSQLHQCDQGLLPNETSLKCFFFSYSALFSERTPIWLHSWHFYHKPCNQRTQGRCARSKKQQISPEILIYTFSGKLYYRYILTKEGSISTKLCSNCKHSLKIHVTHTKGMQLR